MKRAAFSFMQKAVSYIKHYLINSKLGKRAVVLLPAAISFVFVLIFMFTFNVTVVTAVSYNGKTIGYVSSEAVYTEAIQKIESDMDAKAKEELKTVDAKGSITAGTKLMDKEGIEKAIVDSIDSVDTCYVLYCNSKPFAVCKTDSEIDDALNKYLTKKANGLNSVIFADNFETKKEYRTYDTIIDSDELYKKLKKSNFAICGIKTDTVKEELPFETKTKISNKYNKGEKVIVQKGEKGVSTIKREIYYNKGKVVNIKVLSNNVTKEPQDEIIVVGTGEKSFTLSYPFSYEYAITSPYGDFRGYYYHQGVDIVAPYGTEILACAGGTVVEAQYSYYGWGNYVVVDHGNGMKTRYAHCSELNVSVGDEVARGEVIAFVGATGDADCNHLHLELISGGARINAANYFVK